ncbi:MAG: carbohydrate binding family 9 domain-containing protein [Candidatus Aminicenantes bacterium]|nr:carbohydrate binding family 9 domain-containing protein [Candidatus Aminicenantes bacterium]
MKIKSLAILLILLPSALPAAEKKTNKAYPPGQKVVQAIRLQEPVQVDGRLEENVWKQAGADGFIQNDPQDGQPSTEPTEVWVAFDDKALYIAAHCRDSEPDKIISRLGRRDSQVESDWFSFAVDPYFDKRTGYRFAVNPAGSIIDETLSNDVGSDSSWDGVWEARTAVGSDGWTVEMKIPFNQIRFAKMDEYVWGINFRRVIQRKNETATFSWCPKDEQAVVSKFARMEGLRDISPGAHIEITPYTTGQAQFRPAEKGNPFENGHKMIGNAGFDLKLGLSSNLTLDASVNPDFGQVEVDPAVVNLSAYETRYQEKRPFFIEGASLFNGFGRGGVYFNANINWPDPTFFYSRRIGRAPQGYVTRDGYTSFPDRSTILGAAKLTGKLGGWNIGFINALTAREYAQIDEAGLRYEEEVEPSSYYGVLRAQKDIADGRHGLGFMLTGVARDIDDPTLAGIMNRNAFGLAVDGFSFLDSKKSWVIGGWVGGTRIEGSVEDILRVQNSSIHYFQRPDATHIELDPSATSLSGWGTRINIAKQNGTLIILGQIGALSPGFNPNDAGYQSGASDVINVSFLPGLNLTKPGKIFQQILIGGGGFANWDFGGNNVGKGGIVIAEGLFRNFWGFGATLFGGAGSLNNRQTRGGPLTWSPGGFMGEFRLNTDGRKRLVLEGYASISDSGRDGHAWTGQLSFRWKPAPNVSFSIGPMYSREINNTQWVGKFSDELMTPTFGKRYVFAQLEQDMVLAEIRLNWTFTPRLSLQAYLQPFIAVGAYSRFKELARPGEYAYNAFGENGSAVDYSDGLYTVDPDGEGPASSFAFGNPDFNVKSLRGTIVLRWEYLPGSLLYFVWTQNRADYANPGTLRLRRDIGDLLTAPGDNIFMIKASYRWSR